MQVINSQCPTQVPQGLGASEKPVPTPPSSAPAGGAFRRGCLSPKGEFRAGRLLGAAQGSRPKADRGWRVAFFASLYGRLPCDKQVFEFWLGGFIAVLYPACWCSRWPIAR